MKRWIVSLTALWVCICISCTPLVAFAGGVGDGGSVPGSWRSALPCTQKAELSKQRKPDDRYRDPQQ